MAATDRDGTDHGPVLEANVVYQALDPLYSAPIASSEIEPRKVFQRRLNVLNIDNSRFVRSTSYSVGSAVCLYCGVVHAT